MAELHVEPRRHNKAWLWVLLLVIVLIVAAWIIFGSGTVKVGALDTPDVHSFAAALRAALPMEVLRG